MLLLLLVAFGCAQQSEQSDADAAQAATDQSAPGTAGAAGSESSAAASPDDAGATDASEPSTASAAGAADYERYVEQVRAHQHPEIAGEDSEHLLRWDLGEPKTIGYRYRQRFENRSSLNKSNMEQDLSATAALNVVVEEPGTARLVLDDMVMKMTVKVDGDERSMTHEMPAIVVPGMQEDGSADFGNTQQDLLMKLLFPLPPKALRVGEAVEVERHMPFNAGGSPLTVHGFATITLSKLVEIDGATCAQLDIDLAIDQLDLPEELEDGNYAATMHGTSRYFFALEERRFVEGTTAVVMDVSAQVGVPSLSPDGTPSGKPVQKKQVDMVYSSLIQVDLREDDE